MTKIDIEFIQMVAKQYDNFEANYDAVDKKWIVRGWAQYSTNDLFWTSDDSVEDFFNELKRFFMEEGIEQYKQTIQELL
jgi:hypothetical protein